MRRTAFLFILLCPAAAVYGQIVPLQSQFFFSPTFQNSAFTGFSRQTEISLVHRQQWFGIKDAPVTSGVNIQYPTIGRVSLGLTVLSSESVLLRNSSAMFSTSYEIPFSENHQLRFGLSVGVGMYKLDVPDGYDDPILGSDYQTNFSMLGNAGIVYQYKRLWASFSLPSLLADDAVSDDSFVGTGFQALDHYQAALGYKVRLDDFGNFALDPYLMYLHYGYRRDVTEGVLRFLYKDVIWAGVLYSSQKQASSFAGVEFFGLARFNYSYEFSLGGVEDLAQPTHEIQVSFKFGKPKARRGIERRRSVEQQLLSIDKSDSSNISIDSLQHLAHNESLVPAGVLNENAKRPERSSVQNGRVTDSSSDSLQNPVIPQGVQQLNRDSGFPPGCYLIAGAFALRENALRYKKDLEAREYYPEILLHQGKQYYYIFIYRSSDRAECILQYESVKQLPEFLDAWILQVK